MIGHYLKISLRAIRKSPLLSLLNILGLSVGLGCFLVITLYLYQENTYEKGFSDYDKIYRIEEEFLGMGRSASSTPNLQYKLDEIPGVESYVRLNITADRSSWAALGEKKLRSPRVLESTEGLFDVFDFKLAQGNAATALDGPHKVVLTKEYALKLFDTEEVVGKTFQYQNEEVIVTGLLDATTYRSHLSFDFICSDLFNPSYADGRWWMIAGYLYVKLNGHVETQDINDRLDEIAKTYAYPVVNNSQLTKDEWLQSANKVQFFAKPIRDIHLKEDVEFEFSVNGDPQSRATLTIIGVFILIIAVINFMNLSTAKSSLRTKEIGVRKVMGTSRRGLVIQFLLESVLITLFSAIIGAGLSELFIFLLNQSLGEVISISIISYPSLGGLILLGVFLVGFLAGVYPAFYLSSVKMIPLLKGMKLGQVLNMANARVLRNSLVVVQFAASSTLIIGVYFVYHQLQHIKQLDIGFDKEQVLVVPYTSQGDDDRSAIRNELLKIPGVEAASFTSRMPAEHSANLLSIMLSAEETLTLDVFQADPHFADVLSLNVVEGAWFAEDQMQTDSLVVLNESAVNAIGLEGNPIGQVFGNYWRVVGVVENFFIDNYRTKVGPAIMAYDPKTPDQLAIKLNAQSLVDALPKLEATWGDLRGEALEFKFLDENFASVFAKEKQNGDAIMVFAALAIFISCLGLFGLAAFAADQRQHEFGIRKVLGAKVRDIVHAFSLDFIKLVLLAFIVSIPIAIYGVNLWLDTYANRIDLSIVGFVVAGVCALAIAFATILFQSLKAGRLNPVETLRNE
ncbi:ABC transporter permease [Roseivirga pacifica]